MHPVIRIVAFLVAAVFLARAEPSVMLVIAVCLVPALSRIPAASWRTPLAVLRRLRWLLISLLVVYAWFTPGIALWPALGVASPTQDGLSEGLLRAAALLLIALAAQLLLLATPRPQLLAALYWLARPMPLLGVSRERLAVRLTLTLDAVPQLSTVMTPALHQGLEGNAVQRFGWIAARAFQGALDRAEAQDGGPICIVTGQPPPLHQWLYPLILGVVLASLS